ncbi:MAG: B12-binding domain-containing radical SAM protein [Promethearchaeota archaeon]
MIITEERVEEQTTMASRKGFEIVLTASRAVMSNYRGNQGMGLSSAFPSHPLFAPFIQPIFTLESDEEGRMQQTHLGLGKIEGALLDEGFSRNQVIVADPTKLNKVIGPNTKAVGITCLDPLGLGYGVKVTSFLIKKLKLPYSQSIIARYFQELITDKTFQRFREKGDLRTIVGGPGVWQIADTGMQRSLGIDCIVEWEGESIAPRLFRQAIEGVSLPQNVRGRALPPREVPLLRTPSRCGIVEITRGCGRGCRFCYPTQIPFRSFPIDIILHEIRLNRRGGIPQVSLHSDDAMRYGSNSLKPNPKAMLQLLQAVKEETQGRRFGFDFFSVASVMQNPRLLGTIAEYMELGGRHFSTIEVGIETGSPDLLAKHMPGKVKPFKTREWPHLVKEAANLLHELQWIVCYSIILGLPDETPDDIQRTNELVDDLKDFNCVIIPIIFMPAGGFRRRHSFGIEDMSHAHWDLYLNCMELILKNAQLFITHSFSPFLQRMVRGAMNFGLGYIRKKIRKWRWTLHRQGFSSQTEEEPLLATPAPVQKEAIH